MSQPRKRKRRYPDCGRKQMTSPFYYTAKGAEKPVRVHSRTQWFVKQLAARRNKNKVARASRRRNRV